MGKLSPAEGTEGSAESEEVKQSDFRFHIEVIILFALNMYVQDLGLERRKMASFEKYIQRRNIIMTKVRKIVAAIMVVTTLATSAVCNLTASAAPNVVSDSYGAFEWESSNAAYAKTTNLCSSGTRTTSASITVYKDNTGAYVTAYYASKNGGYGTIARASQSSYKSNGYNFKMYGAVSNSTNSSAGLATSLVKYVN